MWLTQFSVTYGTRQGKKGYVRYKQTDTMAFSTPSSYGHSPYILLSKTQGESVRCISLSPLLGDEDARK